MASPRSLTSIPYDAASQFNRYFESDKVDCKYNPNSADSPKPEFQQQVSTPHTPQQQQHPNSGKDNNDIQGQGGTTNLVVEQVVKTEQPEINNVIHATSFGGLAVAGTGGGGVVVQGADDVVVDLQHFVSTNTAVVPQPHAPPPSSVVATTATATQMSILVRSRCSLVEKFHVITVRQKFSVTFLAYCVAHLLNSHVACIHIHNMYIFGHTQHVVLSFFLTIIDFLSESL